MADNTVQYKDFAGVTWIAAGSNSGTNVYITHHNIVDATNANIAAVKAASTAAAATDPALVVALSPSDPKTYLETGSTGGAAANNQTLTGTASTFVYLAGFDVTGLGATGASTIAITITGLKNTLTYYYTVPAGVSTAAPVLSVRFSPPIQASTVNVPIVVNVPSFGSGNLTAAANAFGYYV